MSDAVRRAIRSFVQGFLAVLISSNILAAVDENGPVDWAMIKKVMISAVAAGVLALLVFVQNWLEDNVEAVPALLKAPASEGLTPTPPDAGGP